MRTELDLSFGGSVSPHEDKLDIERLQTNSNWDSDTYKKVEDDVRTHNYGSETDLSKLVEKNCGDTNMGDSKL